LISLEENQENKTVICMKIQTIEVSNDFD